jgi:uncharacterized protein (TIGR03437 family)
MAETRYIVPWLCSISFVVWPAIGQNAGNPNLSPTDVVSAADHRGGGVVPGEVIVLFPNNAGPPEMVPWGLDANLAETTLLGETRVLFDGVAVPLVYAKRGEVSTVVPFDVAGKKTTEVTVEYQGRRSSAATLEVIDRAPALFSLDGSGKGQAAMLNDTGCCNSVRNPAVRGKTASLYATGQGRLSDKEILRHVSVTVGGTPARIDYVGTTGCLQVDFRVPRNAPIGDAVPVVLTVDHQKSSPDVTMAVRSARQRVAVVASDSAARNLMTRTLRTAGYDVFVVRKSEPAEDLAEQKPDLAIVDLKMPRDEISAMLQKVRNAHPQVRIMLLATPGPNELREADLLGAQAVLTTPANNQKILARVSMLLRRKPAVY